ncbi:MAG: TrkA family potassium uptake protein [Christensenellaceae bacterium]|nr:TrkA family potassium uptake protein [Christensenellaceae bacterium]
MKKQKQFAVIGLGKLGMAVALELERIGHQVLAIDRNLARVDASAELFTHCVQADSTDAKALRALGLHNMDGVVVAVGDLESSIMITMLLKEQGVGFVCAKAGSDMHSKLLKKVGADKVVFPERDMGTRLAHSVANANITEVIELSGGCSIVELRVLPAWQGKSLKELALRRTLGINVVGTKTDDNQMNLTPDPDRPLEAKEMLVIVGSDSAIAKLNEY